MTTNYNLLDEHWIPVLYRDGRYERIGIRSALKDAGQIRQIAASNPMDNVALLRFLLAVLVWCKVELTENDRTLLESEADGIPPERLDKLSKYREKFNLLGDGERFYQDKSVPSNDRPIGDLLVEFPTETKIAHFRHVRDREYGLCPACCALGIIRFCAWANAYGGGRYTSAVNGPTPAYAVAQDSTLLRTILLHWPENAKLRREPPWTRTDQPRESDLDIVTVFAWRSRRLWLGDPKDEGWCSYCGAMEKLICRHAFTGNWKPPFQASGQDKKFWSEDPHLILVGKTQGGEDDADTNETDDDVSTQRSRRGIRSTAKQSTLGFPSPGARAAAHTRFWRRALTARLASNAPESEPSSIAVTGPAANKGLYQDATSVCLPRGCCPETIGTANKAVEDLSHVLRSSTPNPQRQHPERKAALDAFSPSLEARLRQELSACQEPKDLRERLQPVVRDVVSATTVGSPLRRREAMRYAASALDVAIWKTAPNREDEASKDDNSQANNVKAAKPERRRKKRETGT